MTAVMYTALLRGIYNQDHYVRFPSAGSRIDMQMMRSV